MLLALFIDSQDYTHKIGINYTGFLYSLMIRNEYSTEFDIDSNPACDVDYESVPSPKDVCLSECKYNELIGTDKSCLPCEEGCITGCIRDTDCRNCLDELCRQCDTFSNCIQCLPGAQLLSGSCQCMEGLTFDQEAERCGDCNDNCSV